MLEKTTTTRHEHNNEKFRVRLFVLLKSVIKVHCYVFVERSVRSCFLYCPTRHNNVPGYAVGI